jgi:hypothetical protein
VSAARFLAALAAGAIVWGGSLSVAVAAAGVEIPLTTLGYTNGVTVAGVAPSVTFDLPRYASLQAAVLHLELHVSEAADPSSTVSVAVNGITAYTRALREIGRDARLTIPLPLPAAGARLFAISVSGALRVAGDPCANESSRKLFLRVGRDSALVVRTAAGGTAEAFFRDYRSAIAVSGADDPSLAAVPYRIDRLEPWHRVDAMLVAAPPGTGRALVLAAGAHTSRRGDVLRIAPDAFATLPLPQGESPQRRSGSVAFGDLRQHLGSASGTGDIAVDVPLAGSITGGVPQHLAVHVALAHSALPAGATGTLQVLVNGVLAGARALSRDAATQVLDVSVPRSIVGPSNNVRVLVSTEIPPAACANAAALSATLLDSSSFSWGNVERQPPSVESFITALSGRVVVLVAPGFTRAAFHVMGEIGKMNAAIAHLDVEPYHADVPAGYDFAIVFAPPDALKGYHLGVRATEPVFAAVNPTDGASVFSAAADTNVGLLELGDAAGTPLLAVTYHGAPSSIALLEGVSAGQLITQVADVSVVDERGVTTYDIGEKLRMYYPGDLTVGAIWSRIRLAVVLALLAAIVLGGSYCARRLTGRIIA